MVHESRGSVPLNEIRRRERDARAAVRNGTGGPSIPPEFSDDAIALRFAAQHADDLRYVEKWARWMLWADGRWVQDDTLHAYDRVRALCRRASAECNKERVAVGLASGKAVASIEKLARSDRRIAATVDQWDSDIDLLNTPGGIVDLRTGKCLPHRREDYCTKITAVAPAAPGTPCPRWMAFLRRVTDGDDELISYLQRIVGYGLTGSVKENALFFAYGTGRNGKGVFINTITRLMGGYATVASMETFTASTNTQHSTDLAFLRGARLVSAQETEDGKRWAESKIKTMTGGDPITARFMRQDNFTFEPQFKLLIAGNHKPSLRSVDEAIKARFNLIPFTVRIPRDERDPDLPEKLRAEWPAILRWALDGCLKWRRMGLAAPEVVRAATKEYLDEEDTFQRWFEECCTKCRGSQERLADLFASWKVWAERAGEFVGTEKRFSQTIRDHGGFEPKREGGTGKAAFEDIMLNRQPYSDDPWSR